MHDPVSNIGEFQIGVVVRTKQHDRIRYGHVIGFAISNANELIIRVQWPEENPHITNISSVHPANLVIV